jgi:hypothetical protein
MGNQTARSMKIIVDARSLAPVAKGLGSHPHSGKRVPLPFGFTDALVLAARFPHWRTRLQPYRFADHTIA